MSKVKNKINDEKVKKTTKKISNKEPLTEVQVEQVDVPKKSINRQSIATLAVGILSLIILITALFFNKGIGSGTKKSKEILDNFYRYMKSEEEVVIYYGSSGCSYCELETPIIKQIKEDYDVDYLYIDAAKLSSGEQKEILDNLDIEGSTPTIVIVKDEQVVDVNVGYIDGIEMVEFFKENNILEEEATYTPEENLNFIDFNAYKDLVANDSDSVIVLGQTTCGHCITAKPVLSHIAGKYDLTINYLNITNMTSDEQTDLIESLKNLGYEDAENLGTPLTIIVKDKKISSVIEGSNPTSYFVREFKKAGIITE